MKTSHAFTRYAWMVVFYLGLVILWGAWVRISGSGAGCGAHWPSCNGEIIPPSPTLATLIEFTHRLTSGLSLPLVLVLLVWGFKLAPKGHPVRWASVGTLVFLLTEAALGAGLVKFELVAEDTSVARAVTASFHLINTFTLSAFAALVAWWSTRPAPPAALQIWRQRGTRLLLPGLVLLLLSGMAGAVTALGDTLFPTQIFAEQGLMAHLKENLSLTTHFLVQLRIVHPIVATATGIYLIVALPLLAEALPALRRHATACSHLLVTQLALGMLNVVLAAPGWMQLLHLSVALLIWLMVLLLWVRSLLPAERQAADSPLESATAATAEA